MRVGNKMAQLILKGNERVVSRRSARPLRTDEIYNNNEEKKRKVFDELIELRWGSSLNFPMNSTKTKEQEFEEYSDADEEARVIPDVEDVVDNTGKRLNQQPAHNKLIHAEIAFHLEETNVDGKVKGGTWLPDGGTDGIYHEDPRLNSMIYDVEFPDGQIKEYSEK